MTRTLLPALALLPLIAGCTLETTTVRLSGAETRSVTDVPRIVPAGFVQTGNGTRMELVTADGTVMSGTLTTQAVPGVIPLAATNTPLAGGGTELAGEVTGANGATMTCRFRLLNAARGLDGGGSGRCEGSDRRVDFLF